MQNYCGAQDGTPLATVDGQVISSNEVEDRVSGPLRELDAKIYRLKEKELNELINDRILEREAQTHHLTVEQLIDDKVNSKLNPPTSKEIESYYFRVRDRVNQPLEAVRSQIASFLLESRRRQGYEEYVSALRAKTHVVIFLGPPRAAVSVDPLRVRGAATAPITIVEFADYECPYCASAEGTLQAILAKYPNQVRLAYRDFPLEFHTHALSLAEASRCAGAQGKYWQYHDYVFAHQSQVKDDDLAKLPSQLGIDAQMFQRCMSQHTFADEVKHDLDDGQKLDIEGTPAFFINGIALSGAVPLANFSREIDLELQRLRGSSN